jgi:hypothetical protein
MLGDVKSAKLPGKILRMYGKIVVSLLEIHGWVSHEKSVELLFLAR